MALIMTKNSDNEILDNLDIEILNYLQNEGRISNAELSRRVELSPPATHARVKRLEDQGYIREYVALLEPEKLGFDMLCFINVGLQMHTKEQVENFRNAIQEIPEVLECYHITGEYDYLLKVIISNRKNLEEFVVRRLTPIQGVARIYTSLVLSEVKNRTSLPINKSK